MGENLIGVDLKRALAPLEKNKNLHLEKENLHLEKFVSAPNGTRDASKLAPRTRPPAHRPLVPTCSTEAPLLPAV